MKKIIEGGLSSKNSPIYTMDSFLLANTNPNIDGIKVDIHLTSDNKIVLINEQLMKRLNINQAYINATPFSKIEKINIGTRVKHNKILSLEEVLKRFNNKYIIVNLNELHDINKNHLLVKILLKHIKMYPNVKWYLNSSSINLLNIVLSYNINVKIGKTINNINELNYSFNFFTIDISKVNLVKNKTNSTIFFSDINTKEKWNFVNKNKEYFKDLFIIINNYNLSF